ncbi:MAG TPA: leucine-rich repeat domain-containing protein [Candidatus Gracilibacteria bacterium]|nr:leucine-rich repeat domain-containing protein [Candidatus Gracilibacteria bacterium]
MEAYQNQLEKIDLKNIPGLIDLDLAYNNLENEDLVDIWNLSNLEILQLHRNKISDIAGVEKLSKLKKIKLEFNQISDVSYLSNLKELKFASTAENPLPAEVIEKWNEKSRNSGL